MQQSCDACREVEKCIVCGQEVVTFDHVGVRAVAGRELGSGVWHIATPCGHAQKLGSGHSMFWGGLATYGGGPLWKAGYKWQAIYWGSYWQKPADFTRDQVDAAVKHIEADPSYSGYLSEYNVGQGDVLPSVNVIEPEPPSTIDDSAIGPQIAAWIKGGLIPELGTEGAYQVFFPPGVTVTLQGSASCQAFCDYHNFDGTHAYTVEPYPCATGCNKCTSSPLDTLTEGLSEEMAELKTDFNPGTGWVVGNLELCDVCDETYKCEQISSGEYVNAWWSNGNGQCWTPTMPAPGPTPPPASCDAFLDKAVSDAEAGDVMGGVENAALWIECVLNEDSLARRIEAEKAKVEADLRGRAEAVRAKLRDLAASR